MKTPKLIKLAFIALLAGALIQGCSKDEEEIMTPIQEDNYSVRPDFATLDTRPPQVIANYHVTDRDAEAVILKKAPVKPGVKGKYALVIGISNYSGTANDLTYCDDDANDWKARLQAEGYSVTILTDLNATKAKIEAAVNNLASLSISGNEIAFCYSGHGSSGNIVSTDLFYISSSWFRTKFTNATSSKMMFSFDACQIGAMATDLNGSGRVIAVASNNTTYSYDGNATMKNGVFTYYQMKGFDSMNYIYLEPDCVYACDQMNAWADTYHVRVAPSFTDNFIGDFDL